jgi:phosphate transport system substrate-binding protein
MATTSRPPNPELLKSDQNRMKRLSLSLALLALGFCAPSLTPNASAQTLINGAGATFPDPLYQKWCDEFKKVDPSVRINYQAIGSGGGQKQMLEQTVDFGASDVPMKDEPLAKAPGKILHLPTVAGAVVITYNLEGNPLLRFDGPVIADIFLGKITQWNDPRIAQLNPGIKLPDADILVAHRSDGSGTTAIFTAYLSDVSPEWKQQVGSDTSVRWPVGLGGKGNPGVAGLVKQSRGAIGYVELIFALQNKLPFADLKNTAGNFVTPSLQSVTAAMSEAQIPDDLRFMIINPPGKKAYPIGGCTYLLVYQDLKDHIKQPSHAPKVVEFLKWAETKGQSMASSLDYAPLPETLRQRVLEKIATIKY